MENATDKNQTQTGFALQAVPEFEAGPPVPPGSPPSGTSRIHSGYSRTLSSLSLELGRLNEAELYVELAAVQETIHNWERQSAISPHQAASLDEMTPIYIREGWLLGAIDSHLLERDRQYIRRARRRRKKRIPSEPLNPPTGEAEQQNPTTTSPLERVASPRPPAAEKPLPPLPSSTDLDAGPKLGCPTDIYVPTIHTTVTDRQGPESAKCRTSHEHSTLQAHITPESRQAAQWGKGNQEFCSQDAEFAANPLGQQQIRSKELEHEPATGAPALYAASSRTLNSGTSEDKPTHFTRPGTPHPIASKELLPCQCVEIMPELPNDPVNHNRATFAPKRPENLQRDHAACFRVSGQDITRINPDSAGVGSSSDQLLLSPLSMLSPSLPALQTLPFSR
ncbi:hypothetical protein B0H11DRAFT_2277026 [Mycena galericulata]|nr:hypothetical protein B0H11DRAFT_2277026 [Mycena galericulata]